MNKKVWSVILLCFIAVSFLLTVVIFVNTGLSLYKLANMKVDSSNDPLPGASVLGVALTSLSIWIGLFSLGGFAASVGFVSSIIDTKIAPDPIIKRISLVSLCVNSGILILLIGILISVFA